MITFIATVFVLAIIGCHGDETDPITHLILLDSVPPSFGTNATPEIVIRTNFSGEIRFQEAEEFKVLLNITAPSVQDAYAVSSDIIDDKGRLLLQVYQKPTIVPRVSLQWIIILIACSGSFVMVAAILYVICWYKQKKHLNIYGTQGYLSNRHMYRSRSMQLGAAAELMGDMDQQEDDVDGDDDAERERRKLEKLRVTMKPETIMEESEDSADDDRTNPKSRFQVSAKQIHREWSLKNRDNPLSNTNVHGSGIVDYPDNLSDDEIENDLSPDQKIATSNGDYTPLDELDDVLHENALTNSQSTAKLLDPRGNLDYNIQTSKSDGDLLGDNKKMSEKEKVIIPPLTLSIGKQKRAVSKEVPVPKRAEQNIYQRGMNLRPQQENDLSSSPSRSDYVRAQMHQPTPENLYVNNSFGQYVALNRTPDQMSKSRTSRESNDAYELYTYPADIPLSTFKTVNNSPSKESPARNLPKIKPKPVFESGSPNAFDFNKLDPKVNIDESHEPISPGNFSMLSEGSSSDSFSNEDDDDAHFIGLDDSDLDIPPPEMDADVLSNTSLPLPSPPPLSNQFMPYDTHGRISQLSPRQSLVSPGDSKEYGTVIAITGSPSPGGPFSKHSVNPEGNRFVFPPPPMMYNPPQHGAWARRELNFQGDDSGEYLALPMDTQGQHESKGRERRQSGNRPDPIRERRQSGGSRKSGGKLPKHLHLTILTTFCVISVLSGVYCLTESQETKVNIVIYVPPSYPYKNSTIYSAVGKRVDVYHSDGMKWFLSSNPILHNFNSSLCRNHECNHGCDENNGQCICHHGYMMKDNSCQDINECQSGLSRCPHPQAGCANTPGSYDCLCMGGYNLYSYNNLCLDCSSPCQEGSYEIQPCKGDKQKKICKECTKSCGEHYFMKQRCTENKDAVCLMCQPKCNGNKEYEFSQCSAQQNRDCRDKETLPTPIMSPNVILDDLTVVRDETVEIPYIPLDFDGVRRFNFERGLSGIGSEFWIEVEIKHFKPIGLFQSVNHSNAQKASDFTGPKEILEKYCPYPVPSEYELSFTKHLDVSYKGNTSQGLDSIEPCDNDPYSFPNIHSSRDQSIFCSEPGPLSDFFQNIEATDYKTTETVWEEKSETCRQQHEACENCSRNCVQQMLQNNNECSVSIKDDNGRSPRLPLCVTCCANENCKDACHNYHDDRCDMVKCLKGNLVQFELKSIYPKSENFYCHVEQMLNQHLIKVEYKVKYLQSSSRIYLLYRNLSVYSDKEWQRTGRIQRKDDIIHIEIDSQLTEIPNFVQWAVGVPNIRFGTYEAKGIPLEDTLVSGESVTIRPNKPFGINPKDFGKHHCEDNMMEGVVISTNRAGPYRYISELLGQSLLNASYLITNKTMAPTVKIGINKNTSVLKAIFRPTKLKFGTLAGNVTYNATHWIALVEGEMENCPGFFNINVTDAKYPEHPLYEFDVGSECPKHFHIVFTIPTGDAPVLSKDVLVHFKDVNSTFTLRIHTPGRAKDVFVIPTKIENTTQPAVMAEETVTTTSSTKEPAHFSILFIAVVAGVTLLLLFLLIFGVAWKQGIPDGDIQRFHLRHLVLLVIYITFQFVYAIIVSMSVFVLVIMAVNGETTSFLKQFNQQRSVTTALSQLTLDTMEYHLLMEFQRQNDEATNRKAQCYGNIQKLIEDVKKMSVAIETETMSTIQEHKLKDLITVHTRSTLDKFSTDLLTFRQNYEKYKQYVLHKLSTELDSTYQSIQKSKWLTGANYLYSFVKINKEYMGGNSNIMSFMNWVNMETDMMKLAKGLTLPLPDLPNLRRDFDTSLSQSVNRHPLPNSIPLSSQTINQWFIQPNIHVAKENKTVTKPAGDTKHVTSLNIRNYIVFFACMIIIDVLWLVHRMVKACGIGKLLLYGYPIYVDVREQKEGPNNEEKKKLNKKSKLKVCGSLFSKALSTFFLPKLIGTLFVCLMVYFVSLCAYEFINRQTFTYLGYYNDMEDIMRINEAVINTRIVSHSERINKMEYPMYEGIMNVNIQNHQHVLNLVETQWNAIRQSHSKLYCNYLGRINVTASCNGDAGEATLTNIRLDGCSFLPVVPNFYDRNVTDSSRIAGSQMDGFLMNIRKLIWDTCYVIIIYLSGIVIKELLGTVLWIYIKRSGFVILRIIYETDEPPGSTDTSTSNK